MRLTRKYKLLLFIILPIIIISLVFYYNYKRSYLHSSLSVIEKVRIPYNTYHVQGLVVTEDYYIISSVDTKHKKGWLFKIARGSLKLIAKKEITENSLYHPGGIHYDGTYLWVCLSKYRANSKAKIIAYDIDTFEEQRSFYVNDHISFIVSDSDDRLYGSSWASKYLYVFDWKGNVITKKLNPLKNRDYQDGTFIDNKIIVGDKGSGYIDFINASTLELIAKLKTKQVNYKDFLTREGFTIFDNNIYLMPMDGPKTIIYICKGR